MARTCRVGESVLSSQIMEKEERGQDMSGGGKWVISLITSIIMDRPTQ